MSTSDSQSPLTVDSYIASFPEATQHLLQALREYLRNLLPDAIEAISYKIPTFKLNGRNVVHFAGYKGHLSIYPIPKGDAAFETEIERYRAGAGTIRLPLDKPLPLELISKLVQYRVAEVKKP
jgi:uncharacterized protein YdhG (YjbR/CyaY superfamily)